MPFRVGSLFAGVGGVCLGFQQAGYNNLSYELAWANEIDEYAAATYRNNFHHDLVVGDIEKIVNLDRCENQEERDEYQEKRERILSHQIDILTGGFPCQPFSIAGERLGFDDHRGNLFLSIIDLIDLHLQRHGQRPRVLFLENVKNLTSHDNGRTYLAIRGHLENTGYIVKEAVLNTMYYSNIPQNRERIFIICFANQQDAERFTLFDQDETGNYINLQRYQLNFTEDDRINQIQQIIDYDFTINELGGYYYTAQRYPHYFINEDKYNAMPKQDRNEERINLDEQITEPYQFYQVRRGMYVRRNMSGVCPTLTANMGTGGHNVPLIRVRDGIRKLTPAETFRLQGFPVGRGYELPRMSDGRLYKQAGNAVSVPVIKFLAEKILEAING